MHREIDGIREQRFSISLVNRPLPPTSANGRPGSVAAGADHRDVDLLGRRPCAAASACRTMRACVSASGLPRVPSRRLRRRIAPQDPTMIAVSTCLYSESKPHATRRCRVVERSGDGPGKILSNVVLSQIAEHAAFAACAGNRGAGACRRHRPHHHQGAGTPPDGPRDRRGGGCGRTGPDRRRNRRPHHAKAMRSATTSR